MEIFSGPKNYKKKKSKERSEQTEFATMFQFFFFLFKLSTLLMNYFFVKKEKQNLVGHMMACLVHV